MRPDERLLWLGKGLVKVEDASGRTRGLRDADGHWSEATRDSGGNG
jgi:hypothetical protein